MRDANADDYLAALRATQGERMAAAEELCRAAERLAQAQRELENAERMYQLARESAEATGWTSADLDRAGLPSVAAGAGADQSVAFAERAPAAELVADTLTSDTPLYQAPRYKPASDNSSSYEPSSRRAAHSHRSPDYQAPSYQLPTDESPSYGIAGDGGYAVDTGQETQHFDTPLFDAHNADAARLRAYRPR